MDSPGSSHLIQIIRAELSPQHACALPFRAVSLPLHGIRVVVFDVYGTLLMQRPPDTVRGDDAGNDSDADAATAFFRAARDTGLLVPGCPEEPLGSALRKHYADSIAREHLRGRAAGRPYPEVDIQQIWTSALGAADVRRFLAVTPDRDAVCELAVRYECRSNPVWPMPDAAVTLRRLRRKRVRLGIISNAQFYTQLVLEALFGEPLADLGFEQSLCLWSYRLGRAKPDPAVFELLYGRLARVRRQEILYVGNDLRKDVAPAAATGFRTCLIASDAGAEQQDEVSARPAYPGRVGITPDRVITALPQVAQIVVSRRTLCGNSSLSLSFC